MSTPTTRSFATPGDPPQQIADFVSAVRGQLNDLSTDEVTELTGGLEADLTDALAEAGSTPAELYGDPAEYASELRAAAGLPPRGAGGVRREAGPGFAVRVERGVVAPAQLRIEAALEKLDAKPWWPGIRDFLVVLRPAWWVLRAWVIVESLFMVYQSDTGNSAVRGGGSGLVLLIAAIVVSVQLGRSTLLPVAWQRITVAAGNLVAVLLLLPAMFTGSYHSVDYGEGYAEPDLAQSGLTLNGEQVRNVFPYDSTGRPLTGVELFDQRGRPLQIGEDDRSFAEVDENGYESEVTTELVPGSPVGSAPRWNSFPLQQRTHNQETGALGPVEPAPLPLSGVPPLLTSPTDTPDVDTPTEGVPTAAVTPTVRPSAAPTVRPDKTEKPTPTATK